MYIPLPPSVLPHSQAAQGRLGSAGGLGSTTAPDLSVLNHIITSLTELLESSSALKKRQLSSSGSQNTNITVGIVVGVLLGVFLIGAIAFLYYYRTSLKKVTRRRHRHRKSTSSKSSKSSSDSGAPPPPPPPPDAE